MTTQPFYPFSAVVGQEQVKISLLLNVVDPKLGGVLIVGPKGSGKSTLVRALQDILPPVEQVEDCQFNCNPWDRATLCPSCRNRLANEGKLPIKRVQMRIVELPLSATEDGLLGTLDVEAALNKGVKALVPGLLAEANQNLLYIDEVNLLSNHLVDCILDPVASGWNVVQRESIAVTHPARFTLVASMNPEEGDLRPQILDRFALRARIETITDPEKRSHIIRRNLAFEDNPVAFRKDYEQEQKLLRERILRARAALSSVKISSEILRAVSETCAKLQVDGFRPDLALVKAARALAAFEGKDVVEPEDVLKVAELVLSHRTSGGGRQQVRTKSIEADFMDAMFKEMPPNQEEKRIELPAPTESELLQNISTPKPYMFRQRRRHKEIPTFLMRLIFVAFTVSLLFFSGIIVLMFKMLIFGVPVGGIHEVLALDQIIIAMGISALILAFLFLPLPGRAKRNAVFFYQSVGTGLQRKIVQVLREQERNEDTDVEEQNHKETQARSGFQKIIHVPVYAVLGPIYKIVLNRGPKLPSDEQQNKKRYKFSLERRKKRSLRRSAGRHSKTEAHSERGRYVSYELPKRRPWDVAFGPTLRAAAPLQVLRKPSKFSLIVKTEDLRVKVREAMAPLTIVLLLDMSESMIVSLENIRNAVLSMHDIAYKKHDRVGLIVFKGSGATILQAPTANLNLVAAKLKGVGASDFTPLATGMFQSWRLLRNETARNRDIVPVLVIISDGVANVPLDSPLSPFTRNRFINHAQADVIDAAFLLQRGGIRTLVINPSHAPIGDANVKLYKAHIEKSGKVWLEPTELLMTIPSITGGYYYGIGEGGKLESVVLTEALGIFR